MTAKMTCQSRKTAGHRDEMEAILSRIRQIVAPTHCDCGNPIQPAPKPTTNPPRLIYATAAETLLRTHIAIESGRVTVANIADLLAPYGAKSAADLKPEQRRTYLDRLMRAMLRRPSVDVDVDVSECEGGGELPPVTVESLSDWLLSACRGGKLTVAEVKAALWTATGAKLASLTAEQRADVVRSLARTASLPQEQRKVVQP